MKKVLFVLSILFVFSNALFAQSGNTSNLSTSRIKRDVGNHTIGVGLNYGSRNAGFGARIGITENIKVQVMYGNRNYPTVKSTDLIAELDYAMFGTDGLLGFWYPYCFVAYNKGLVSFDQSVFGPVEDYNWQGWSIGSGVEVFPKFLGKNCGVYIRGAFGSTGSVLEPGTSGYEITYGAGIHYYFK